MSEDRRGAFRRNAFTFGAVEVGGRRVVCLVWDVNETGALIELEELVDLPDRVRVQLAEQSEWREATVAWRREKRAGLSFAA